MGRLAPSFQKGPFMATSVTDLYTRVTSRAAARTLDARKIYGKGQTEVRALDGVSVEFEAGRFAAIMGPSGSGKSTLLQCTAGLDSLTSGKAFIGDADVSAPAEPTSVPSCPCPSPTTFGTSSKAPTRWR